MTVTQADKKLWKVFSEFIRLRDADENGMCSCFTCGRVKYWREVDCGHGLGRQHKSTKYHEKNNHAQCKRCNGFEGGMREVYKEKMDQRYGKGTWNLLEMMSRKPSKWGVFEMEQLTIHYKKEVEGLRKKICA